MTWNRTENNFFIYLKLVTFLPKDFESEDSYNI